MRTTGWLGWRKSADAGLGRRIADFAGVLFLTGLLVGGSCTSNDATKGPSFPSTTVGTGAATTIRIAANPGTLNCGGTSTITATVLNANGVPILGIQVVFSAAKGSLSATTATTNAAGQASVTWTASNIPTCITGASGATETAGITAASGALAAVTVTLTVVVP